LEIGDAVAAPDGQPEVEIRFNTVLPIIVGLQNDLYFDPTLLDLDAGDCTIEPTIGMEFLECAADRAHAPCKQLVPSVVTCADLATCSANLEGFTRMRALVLSLSWDFANLIPSGVVYRCRFHVHEDANSGVRVPLTCGSALGSTADGVGIPITCRDGHISISGPPKPTPTPASVSCVGDCAANRTVTVDELITGINIALGDAELDQCFAFDCNHNGQVTVDCLVKAVNNALTGCIGG